MHPQLGLTISHHADQSLNSFCQWQSGLLGKGGKRHDHAVLLTGLDICSWKNEPCDTLGMNKSKVKAVDRFHFWGKKKKYKIRDWRLILC